MLKRPLMALALAFALRTQNGVQILPRSRCLRGKNLPLPRHLSAKPLQTAASPAGTRPA